MEAETSPAEPVAEAARSEVRVAPSPMPWERMVSCSAAMARESAVRPMAIMESRWAVSRVERPAASWPMASVPVRVTSRVRSPAEAARTTSSTCSTFSARSAAAAFSASSWAMRASAAETRRPTLRSASRRWGEGESVSVAKKSMVPTTSPSTTIGKQTPDFTPTRWATGARTQSVISPRSGVKNRSRLRQARPESPTPSAKEERLVTSRNSGPASPDSSENRSVRSLGSTVQ
ncbi:hypothetical protein ASF47_05270 [Nocardioides sp. Leaf285]|nr:hypothetical protein ASF47_05270 [Nocardioides sp. Leaf285]